jgi:hypothetical protein
MSNSKNSEYGNYSLVFDKLDEAIKEQNLPSDSIELMQSESIKELTEICNELNDDCQSTHFITFT